MDIANRVKISEGRVGALKLVNKLPFALRARIGGSRMLSTVFGAKFWGLNNLDKKLAKIIDKQAGYFVELGANDGLSQSNTKHFELFRGWRGLLIEPHPSNFARLKRARESKNAFANAACVSFTFPSNVVRLRFSNLMTTSLDVATDLPNPEAHAEAGRRFLNRGQFIHDFYAPARTLQSLLDEHHAPQKIDLLSLDVEGAEIEVLSGIDHHCYRFSWILVESRNLNRMEAFLNERGYTLYAQLSHHDFLFRGNE